jgi:uncharacterized membrane protein HdeD (DUF308 family)
MTKSWYQSKTIWIGILTTLAGVIPLVVELINKQSFDAGAIAAVVLGVIQIVRRVWLDGQPLPIG